ncbi:MAG: ketopantoate reductase family protein [Phreatobacter sp.]
MKVCVYGAGAIGGHLAARLIAKGDAEISVVARGAHLAAIRDNGLFLETEGKVIGGKPHAATDDPAELPPQDLVVLSLKAPSLPAVAKPLRRLLAPSAAALFFNNGIPWWWRYGIDDGGSLALLDPGGLLWRELGPDCVLGGVVYSSNALKEPGVVTHYGANRWIIGEPTGDRSPRAEAAAELFEAAGLNAPVSEDIRRDMWEKLFRNVAGNPLSAITRVPTAEWSTAPGIGEVGRGLINETVEVAKALGWDLGDSVDPGAIVNPPAGRAGGRSSMLQDVEAGRPMEVEAIVGQVQAFGREAGVATPTIDVILPLLRGLDAAIQHKR